MQVRPRHEGDTCSNRRGLDAAGKTVRCHRKATMRLDDLPYCDQCAGPLLAAVCGRPVKIRRG